MLMTKSEHQQQVEAFMLRAAAMQRGTPQEGLQDIPLVPTEPSLAVRKLRAKLIIEEALETVIHGLGIGIDIQVPMIMRAIDHCQNIRPFNMQEVIDGCCDLRVVTTGTMSACGIPDQVFQDAVDHNNLMKFAPGVTIREDGKIVKPPDHKGPYIKELLETLKYKMSSYGVLPVAILSTSESVCGHNDRPPNKLKSNATVAEEIHREITNAVGALKPSRCRCGNPLFPYKQFDGTHYGCILKGCHGYVQEAYDQDRIDRGGPSTRTTYVQPFAPIYCSCATPMKVAKNSRVECAICLKEVRPKNKPDLDMAPQATDWLGRPIKPADHVC